MDEKVLADTPADHTDEIVIDTDFEVPLDVEDDDDD